MALIGVGIDLADVDRIEGILKGSHGLRFVERVYTASERAYCQSGLDTARRYGVRFAAKEAFFKAIGAPEGLCWKDVEVVRDSGRPSLSIRGAALDLLAEIGVGRVHLSLTHEGSFAAAVVVLEG